MSDWQILWHNPQWWLFIWPTIAYAGFITGRLWEQRKRRRRAERNQLGRTRAAP